MNIGLRKKMRPVRLQYVNTFGYRTKCKFCLSGPKHSYFVMSKFISNQLLYENKRYSERFVRSYLGDSGYLNGAIKSRDVRISFLFDPTASYTSKMQIIGSKYQQNADPFSIVVECGCGKTKWAFTNSTRYHIANRKCNLLQDISIKSLYRMVV